MTMVISMSSNCYTLNNAKSSTVYKGSPTLNLDELPPNVMAGAIVGSASVIAALSVVFWLPFVYCKTVRNDYSKRIPHRLINH